jgi:hypothetical protein
VSLSFRLDPPAEILPSRPLLPPAPSIVARLSRAVGVRDLRLAATVALAALAVVLAGCLEGRRRRTALALALLMAPMAVGTAIGSPLALSIAAIVGSWAAALRGASLAAGAVAGVAVALDHRALLVVPFLLILRGRPAPVRGLLAAAGSYLLLVAPVALLDPGAFVARVAASTAPGPGLGLFNVLAYRGAEASSGALVLAAVAPLLLAGLVLWLLTRAWPPLALGGIASLAGIVLSPEISAEAVAVPILLFGLAAMEGVERTEGPEGTGTVRNGTGDEHS